MKRETMKLGMHMFLNMPSVSMSEFIDEISNATLASMDPLVIYYDRHRSDYQIGNFLNNSKKELYRSGKVIALLMEIDLHNSSIFNCHKYLSVNDTYDVFFNTYFTHR